MPLHLRPSGRALERYYDMKLFRDSENRPYLHLIDGGVSDNIGVRGVLETLEEAYVSARYSEQAGLSQVRRAVVIVVNARSEAANDWGQKESPPGMTAQLLQSSGVPIERYSFETVELMRDRAATTAMRRELRLSEAMLAGATREEAEARIPKVDLHIIEVSFDNLRDPQQRSRLMNLPTSFVLPDDDVDALRDAAGELLRQSPDYQRLMQALDTL